MQCDHNNSMICYDVCLLHLCRYAFQNRWHYQQLIQLHTTGGANLPMMSPDVTNKNGLQDLVAR